MTIDYESRKYLLRTKQSYPLETKVRQTEQRIREWYDRYDGRVYVSFSGGKDSTVLLDIVRRIYPDVPGVFVDTGLEYPEIREHVKRYDNITWLKPKKSFAKIIREHGFPVTTKRQARYISDIQNASERNKVTVNLRLTGMNSKGELRRSMMISKCWLPLAYSDIPVSDLCCEHIKKEPFRRYVRETGRMPMSGVMASESDMREQQWLQHGCNAYDISHPISHPLGPWNDGDIYAYCKKYTLPLAKIYETESSTGCMFCMFGVHLEKGLNRFQRMQISHPKQYDYCINKLGCGEVLDFIGVDYVHPDLVSEEVNE